MKRFLLGVAAAALLIGAALAAAPISGQLYVSPVTQSGSIPFNSGPTMSAIAVSGGTVTLASGAASLTGLTLTANSVIIFTLKTASGTISGLPYLTAISATAGTATVSGGGSDNSTYNYVILG
jgi:opacity protein-like surface antigen